MVSLSSYRLDFSLASYIMTTESNKILKTHILYIQKSLKHRLEAETQVNEEIQLEKN